MAPGAVVNDDLENYGVDDFGVDPFADSGDENANNTESQSKKRKDASGLGIEEAVAVSKKSRVPRVKLDDRKLLSEKGLPRLRRKAGDLKFKGKGHEVCASIAVASDYVLIRTQFSDTARLLSFYQLWLDDLYPKAKFLDALGMVEKAGHTRQMRMARMEWIDEGKPKDAADDNEDIDGFGEVEGRDAAKFPARVAPIFQNSGRPSERPKTPSILNDDLFGEDDLYDATPKALRNVAAGTGAMDEQPDEDEDLDALMAEEEARQQAPVSIFGNGQARQQLVSRPAAPDEDDLDALMAEAEATSGPSIEGQQNQKELQRTQNDNEDDPDALMAEAEAQTSEPISKPSTTASINEMLTTSNQDPNAEEEEAMAEMDGLW